MRKLLLLLLVIAMAVPAFASLAVADSALEPVELVWYFPGGYPQADQDMVFAEVNKMLKEKMNTTVDFRATAFGDYQDKINVVINSGEAYDICFTSNWLNNYGLNVSKGAFLPLDDLLAQYAPKTYAQVPAAFWDATRVGGKIYAVVCEQISARIPAYGIPKDKAEQFGFDVASIRPNDVTSIAPFMQKAIEEDPTRYFNTSLDIVQEYLQQDWPAGFDVPGAIEVTKGTTVVNQYKTDAMKKFIADMRSFKEQGFQYESLRITRSVDPMEERRTYQSITGMGGTYKPGGAVFASNINGYETVEVASGTPVLTTSGIIATMQALGVNAKNPERAMMLLELLNSTEEGAEFNPYYNTLVFGIQGTHWNYVEGFLERTDAGMNNFNCNTDWMFASNFQAIPYAGQPADVWEQTRQLNASAIKSPVCGFVFDISPIKDVAGTCATVVQEYRRAIEIGMMTEEDYQTFITRLDQAGADQVIAEMQKQVDAWLAAR